MTTERSRRDGGHVILVLSLHKPAGNLELRCWTRIRLLRRSGMRSAAVFDEQQSDVVVELPSDMALQLGP